MTSAAWPEADAIHGREAAWKFYIEVTSAFEGHALAPHAELVDAGPNTVLVHHKQTLRGRTSGANVGMDYWLVVTFRDGVMIRDQWFADRAAAFDAARASA